MATLLELTNMALSSLGEPPISDLTADPAKARKEAVRWNDHVRQSELMAFDWPFSVARAVLTADATAPAFGWGTRHAIPADCVRILPLTEDGEEFGKNIDHEIEGGFLLTNRSGDLRVRYIRDQTDATTWPLNFQKVYIAALARTLAENITGLSQALGTAQSRYEEAWQRAHRYEIRQQGTPVPHNIGGWVEERGV